MDEINYIKAFRIILEKSLNIDKDKNLVVLYDEHFLKYFKYLSGLVNDLKLKVAYVFVPEDYQNVLLKNEEFKSEGEIQLPKGIIAAIHNSDIVLNFLSGGANSIIVRVAVLNLVILKGVKVAHCPNITDEILELVLVSSFEKIHYSSEMMAWLIGNSKTIKIISKNSQGKDYELNIGLDGWNNDPFISSGVICEDSWGNITPGESFCCPDPSKVNGSICINGSIPGYADIKGFPLLSGEFLELTFSKGKIKKWYSGSSKINNYLQSLKKDSEEFNDPHWNTFAEFGIGLNPEINVLTGNPLFDEKMANTIHIAIGRNNFFGHSIQSRIHHDLIVLNPDVFFDGKKLIDKGRILYDEINELRNSFVPPKKHFSRNDIIKFLHAKIYSEHNDIKRILISGNRKGYLGIFNKNQKIPDIMFEILNTGRISYPDLVTKFKKAKIKIAELRKILEIFIHYNMANISKYS